MEDSKQQYPMDANEESPLEDQASKAKENREAKNGEVKSGEVNGHSKGEAKNGDSVHQPPQQVSKQVHYGTQTYVSGYNTTPIVNTAVGNYVANEPVHVEKPYAVPYDVVKHAEQVVQVPSADETGTTLEEILAIARSQQPDECDGTAVCVDDDSADSEGIND